MVIGRSKRPRCFHQIALDMLPVKWESNPKAWMNIEIFSNWLRSFDRKMRAQERQVLLFLDNTTCHLSSIQLTNVTLHFLLPNTTHLQPLDQGIIKTTKVLYRKSLVRHMLAKTETCSKATDISRSVSVLDAIHWLSSAWNDVQPATIRKCFQKAGFQHVAYTGEEEETEDGVLIAHEAELVDLLTKEGLDKDWAQQYATLDSQLFTDNREDSEWEKSILEEVRSTYCSSDVEGSDHDTFCSEDEHSRKEDAGNSPSYKEALACVQGLKTFSTLFEPKIFPTITSLEAQIEELAVAHRKSMLRQQQIDCFFSN